MEEGPMIRINFGRYLKPSEAPCSFCGVDIPGKAGFLLKIHYAAVNRSLVAVKKARPT